MARTATGNVYESRGRFYARISIGGRRPNFHLPWCATRTEALSRLAVLVDLAAKLREAGQNEDAERILERAARRQGEELADVIKFVDAILAGRYRASGKRGAVELATMETIGQRWTTGELHKEHPDHIPTKRSSYDDKCRLERHVYPIVKGIPITSFSMDHADAVMGSLPPGLSPSSRRHIAQLMHRIMSLAVFPLRIITANPIPPGYLPSPGGRRALTYLYPDEDRKLLASTTVPLAYRLVYGFLTREGLRSSEAAGLTWADVDLVRGAVRLDVNKTDDPRAWALAPGTVAALLAWKELGGAEPEASERVFLDPSGRPMNVDRLAEKLRSHLRDAKIEREELFEESAARRPIRAHDLRASFITISLATGRTETFIADRTGHRSSTQINAYRRAARTVEQLGLGDLLPLVEALPELAANWRRRSNASRERDESHTKAAGSDASLHNPSALGSGAERHGGSSPLSCTISAESQENSAMSPAERRDVSEAAPPIEGGPAANSPPADPVEAAIADALTKAVTAGEWGVVAQLGRELEARRTARASSNVLDLASARTRKGGK